MIFRRKERSEGTGQPQGQPAPAADPRAVLRDEIGLYQLWFLEFRLQEEVARAARSGNPFCLAMWQLRLLPGEVPSPELLRQAAELINSSLRTYDVLARIDAQRFVAILIDAPYESAATVAFRIKGELQLRVQSAGRWQAGVGAFPNDGVDGNALISTAMRRLDTDARAA